MDVLPKRWNLDEWTRMTGAGLLDSHALLLEGEVFEMCPQGSPHATALGLTQEELSDRLPGGMHLRVQMPLYLGSSSDPEPDLAVVPGTRRDYADQHPRTAVLVVEISDSSLSFDCGRKAQIYARHGIPEYWVLDVGGRRLLRHTLPHELGYGSVQVFTESEELIWETSIRVAGLLP